MLRMFFNLLFLVFFIGKKTVLVSFLWTSSEISEATKKKERILRVVTGGMAYSTST